MTEFPAELRALVDAGALTHLSTINPDGSPHVNLIWIGLDGDQIVSGHMSHKRIVRNMERDPRVVLSFDAPREDGATLNPYALLHARATVEPSDRAWDLLDDLAKIYVSADTEFPAPNRPGYIARYTVERIGGVGPWVS